MEGLKYTLPHATSGPSRNPVPAAAPGRRLPAGRHRDGCGLCRFGKRCLNDWLASVNTGASLHSLDDDKRVSPLAAQRRR